MNQNDIDALQRANPLDQVLTSRGTRPCGCRAEVVGWKLRGTVIAIHIWPCHADCPDYAAIVALYTPKHADKLEIR